MIKCRFLIALLPLFFIACKENNGMAGGIIKPEKMRLILWDFYKAEAYTQAYIKKDSSKNPVFENAQLQQKIFFIHGVQKKDFYKSYAYYQDNPEQMRTILDSINVKAERLRSPMMNKKYSSGNNPSGKE
jgi:hypothetical protein